MPFGELFAIIWGSVYRTPRVKAYCALNQQLAYFRTTVLTEIRLNLHQLGTAWARFSSNARSQRVSGYNCSNNPRQQRKQQGEKEKDFPTSALAFGHIGNAYGYQAENSSD